DDGTFLGADVITLNDEKKVDIMYHPFESTKSFSFKNCRQEILLHKVMKNGKRLFKPKKLIDIAQFSQQRLRLLSEEFKRFNNPHIYKIGLSDKLNNKRNQLIEEYRKK